MIWGSSFYHDEGRVAAPFRLPGLQLCASFLPALFYFHGRSNTSGQVPRDKIFIIFMSGCVGKPCARIFYFCVAEEGIDSALAGTLNSLKRPSL